ncbi:MAG TPA: sigma-54 dependent transcriptional regulator [Geobacteraceae bacterium]|jgi:DNA-binding NtrC family response regulator|nr:sigma-54 dependent transcriptional regulator [Geobacteraceae bacterium]
MGKGRILVTDDDKQTRELIATFLGYKGYEVLQAGDGMEAFEKIEANDVDLVITDLMMPRVNGLEFMKKVKAVYPEVVTIVYSAFGNSEMAANLLKAGAFFYLEKPFDLEELEQLVSRGLEHRSLQSRSYRKNPCVKNRSLINIIGESPKMLALFELIEKVAESDSTVLIQGESGTGKELVAKAIHELSDRKNRNFVAVNCGAIPDELLESELFGHVKGSFTGATATRVGRFEMADKGTLFLDEIGDMKSNLQVKLLRVLQSRELEPVGATRSKKIDVRIIAATHQNLEKLVEERSFREDLFYRLSVIPILIPPLRERREDIPLLIGNFTEKFNREKRRNVTGFAKDAMEMLCNYSWPGNVRELENLVERMVIIKGSGAITAQDLPEKYRDKKAKPALETVPLPSNGICLASAVEEFENRLIMQALEKTGGNKKEAAILLNLKRTTFIEKLKKKRLFTGDLVLAH